MLWTLLGDISQWCIVIGGLGVGGVLFFRNYTGAQLPPAQSYQQLRGNRSGPSKRYNQVEEVTGTLHYKQSGSSKLPAKRPSGQKDYRSNSSQRPRVQEERIYASQTQECVEIAEWQRFLLYGSCVVYGLTIIVMYFGAR